MTALEMLDVTKAFNGRTVLNGASLTVESSTFTVLCGPPACGKSTLARIVCGLEEPESGRVTIAGRDVTGASPGDRHIGYVPQSFALFPHYSVRQNIAYPLQMESFTSAEVNSKTVEVAEMLGVGDLLDKRVDQISGGQKQRVALARGLIKDCDLYVLDDPLVGLDFKLREQLVVDLRLLQKHLNATFLYLTSEPLEAMVLADVVSVLDGGVIAETSPMPKAYLYPQTLPMARALGFPRVNILPATVERGEKTQIVSPLLEFSADATLAAESGSIALAIRPESVGLEEVDGAFEVPVTLELVEDLGADSIIHFRSGEQPVTACHPSDSFSHEQMTKTVWIRQADIKVFDAGTGALLHDYQEISS